MRRTLCIALTLAALLGASTIAEAACRPESGLACNQVIDTTRTRVIQLDRNRFAVQLVLTSRPQFQCNGSVVPIPRNCPKDGVQYKPEISANIVNATNNAALCTLLEGSTVRPGQTDFGFRIRFEQNNSPRRKTCVIRFNMPSDFPGQSRALPFTLVNATNVAPEE